MENLSENLESDEFVDKLLIECVKQRPSLYNTDIYSAADERQWDELQKLFGMQSKYVDHLGLNLKSHIFTEFFSLQNRIMVEKTMANHS